MFPHPSEDINCRFGCVLLSFHCFLMLSVLPPTFPFSSWGPACPIWDSAAVPADPCCSLIFQSEESQLVGLDLWGGFHRVKADAVGLSFCSRRPPKSTVWHALVSPETSPSLSGI